MRHSASLLRPDRLRSIDQERPFGWLSCRLLTSNLLRRMSTPAKLLYLHLSLAADRQGLSFWGDLRLQDSLGLNAVDLQQARRELIDLDLLDFDGHTYQLLSLPDGDPCKGSQPPSAPPPLSPAAPPDICPPGDIPEDARLILRRLLGREFRG